MWVRYITIYCHMLLPSPPPAPRLYGAEVPKLTQAQKEAIFVLAALKVMNHPKHPAHFAFWAKNVLERTAQVVDSVLRTSFSHTSSPALASLDPAAPPHIRKPILSSVTPRLSLVPRRGK